MKHSFSHYITRKFSKSALIIASAANPPPFPPPFPPPSSVSRFLRCTLWPQCSFAKRALSPSSSSFFWHSTHRILAQKRPASRCTNIRFGPKKSQTFFCTIVYLANPLRHPFRLLRVSAAGWDTEATARCVPSPRPTQTKSFFSSDFSFPFCEKNVPFFLPSLSFPADCALPCYNTP